MGETGPSLDEDAERRLVARLVRNDEAAFSELVLLYQQRVYRLVLRMLGNRSEAEDLAQEVFVSVFKSIHRFRGDARLSTWIYRVAMNHCKNRLKYLARRSHVTQTPFEPDHTSGTLAGPGLAESPDRLFEGQELQRTIQLGLAELEDDQRELIVLREIENLSYEEIQQVTGLAQGTVKSRLHRARASLKGWIEKHQGART